MGRLGDRAVGVIIVLLLVAATGTAGVRPI